MKNLKKYIGLCGIALLPAMAQAQTIGFDTEDYGTLGVYDTWEQSPFRTGELEGNVAVVDNHLQTDDVNTSAKILGIQRSRFGSNTFGAKIDLKETFELTTTTRYVHVMMHKPKAGRVMLIGLGKRADRASQSNQVEQFWSYPINEVKTDEWFDAVFPIAGNGGIDIHSLVVVPDCEPPHTLDSDFVAYIDDIVINSDNKPRVGLGDYAVNFSPDAGWGRDDRKITSISLNNGSDGNQTISISESELMLYMKKFETPLKVKAGDNVKPVIGYSSSWMHGYVYIDKAKDGQFSYGVTSGDLLDSSTDLVAYSLYRSADSGNAHNSAGTSISESNNGFNRMDIPSFTIPTDLARGIYRMRYKLDWNNIDPGGAVTGSNTISGNGGGVIDVLLNVHDDEVSVTQDNRNGEVLVAETGLAINNNRIPFGQAFKIKMNPSNGFEYNGIRVRHGYNLHGDSLVKSTPQYRDEFFYIDQFDSDDCFTIPASVIDGDILIEGLFVEEGKGMHRTKITYNITLDGTTIATKEYEALPGAEYPEPEISSEASSDYYTISGQPEGTVPEEDTVIELVLTQNLPFVPSTAIDENTTWYNLTITSNKNKLIHDPSKSYIDLTASGSGENAQWAFIGDVINGFKIVNRAAGEGYVLSSSTSVTSSNDGSVYPVMTTEPVAETNNTYWIPTKSTSISGESNAFYLHQLGYPSNRMNSRDSRLAYWVGGADNGSTFLLTIVDETMPAIDYCTPQPVSGRSVSDGKTNRTDRYVTSITVSDGTSTTVVGGSGTSSNRPVYTDHTSTIFRTEPGKQITFNTDGYGWAMRTMVYIDQDLNGFDSGDKIYTNYDGTGSSGNYSHEITYTLRDDLATGYYRVRYIINWTDHNDPCIFGDSGSDNGEVVIDFNIYVTAHGTINYSVTGDNIVADNIVEVWSKVNPTTGKPTSDAVQYAQGQEVATGPKTQAAFIFIPPTGSQTVQSRATSPAFESITITCGDKTVSLTDNEDDFILMDADDATSKYHNALCYILKPLTSDVEVGVILDSSVTGIDKIEFDPADGPIDIYNLQGIKVKSEHIAPGIYIMRQGKKIVKILKK